MKGEILAVRWHLALAPSGYRLVGVDIVQGYHQQQEAISDPPSFLPSAFVVHRIFHRNDVPSISESASPPPVGLADILCLLGPRR